MKIHIFYQIHKSGWGGGNQFLKALRTEFQKKGVYAEIPKEADVILFNSHQDALRVISLKRKYPQKVFIHRIDGPIHEGRGSDTITDKIIYKLNGLVSDGTIFQSDWSKEKNRENGLNVKRFEIVIPNAPDTKIFYPEKKKVMSDGKIRIIASSWSANRRKGFPFLEYLDKHLDFSQYEFVFAGNSPVKFQNIKTLGQRKSNELADELRKSDIFWSGSQAEACSNSLLEALACGLPAVLFDNPSHRESARKAGEYFRDNDGMMLVIEKVQKNYEKYVSEISLPTLAEVSEGYYNFCKKVFNEKDERHAISFVQQLSFFIFLLFYKIKRKL